MYGTKQIARSATVYTADRACDLPGLFHTGSFIVLQCVIKQEICCMKNRHFNLGLFQGFLSLMLITISPGVFAGETEVKRLSEPVEGDNRYDQALGHRRDVVWQ